MIKELRAKLEAATPGPWRALPNGVFGGPTMPRKVGIVYWDDAALIVSAINALPALLAVVEAAEEAVEAHAQWEAAEQDSLEEARADNRRHNAILALRRSLASLTRNDEVDRG